MALLDTLASVGKIGIERMSRAGISKQNGTITLDGITGKAEIIRDKWGIPHIYADNLPDLLFAQGYSHAQDRLWQMEINRRAATGTLSEVLGSALLETDIASRTLGFYRLAMTDKEHIDSEIKTLLTAYTAGINAFIESHKGHHSVEFQLLRYRPRAWTVDDTLAFSRLLSWQLSHAWQSQLIRARIIERVGATRAADLELVYTPHHPTILEKGVEVNIADNAFLRGLQHHLLSQNGGSNSWALPPHRTTTGNALLCNDPHLGISVPAIWYENHLHCPELHVTGVSVPAFPLVQIGHNEHVAWGITLAFTDCEDLFVETCDPKRTAYLYQDQWLPIEKIEERIVIKGQKKEHIETISATQHGVIISDIVGYSQKSIALQSTVLQPNMQLLQAWLGINRATDFDSFVAATQFMDAPQLNLTYADTKGNVGYCLTGKTPIRKQGNGKVPVPGCTGEFEWTGYIPFNEMPRAFNPAKGYVMTANHRVAPDDYPYYLGEAWMNGYRAQRIEDELARKGILSPEDCRHLQCDVLSLSGKQFAQHYADIYQTTNGLQVKNTSENGSIAKDISEKRSKYDLIYQQSLYHLATWDGQLTAESIGGCLYHITYHCLMRQLLLPSLGESLLHSIMGNGFHPAMNPTNEYQGHLLTAILRLLEQPNNDWFKAVGGKRNLLENSLRQAIAWLQQHVGKRVIDWQWGKVRVVEARHALSVQSPLDKIFNVGPFPVGGDAETVCQASSLDGTFPNKRLISASYRQVIDLGDFSRSQAIMPPGQSGHLGSSHYQDQMRLWLQGKLRPMLWTREQVEAYRKKRLLLHQGKKER